MEEPEQKPGFEEVLHAVADDVTEALDQAVGSATRLIAGENGNRLIGGAAIGALAAIVLPISLIGGALLGAGYAAVRRMNP